MRRWDEMQLRLHCWIEQMQLRLHLAVGGNATGVAFASNPAKILLGFFVIFLEILWAS